MASHRTEKFTKVNVHCHQDYIDQMAMIILFVDLLGPDNMREVLDWTWEYRASWKLIGIELEVNIGTLKAIDKDHKSVEDCLIDLIDKWLRGNATRSAMTRALQSSKVSSEETSAKGIALTD